ncbi:MAG: Mur ligase family protein [Dongiaceae bacterium]
MPIVGRRFLTGPNLHDDASGLVIEDDLAPLPAGDAAIELSPERLRRLLEGLGFAALQERWLAAAARGRPAMPGPLLRLAAGLLAPWSVAPPGATVIGWQAGRVRLFLRCEHPELGERTWALSCAVLEASRPGAGDPAGDPGPAGPACAAFREAALRFALRPATLAVARAAARQGIPCYRRAIPGEALQLGQGSHGRQVPGPAGSAPAADSLRRLFPRGTDGRIPTCAITGSLGKTTTANMVARILAASGLTVGRCTTTGVRLGTERLRAGDCAGGRFARELLLDARVEAGVFELARGGLLKEGMVLDDCTVGAVLNVSDNHVGADGIGGREDLAAIKAIVARRSRETLVLNAEDPLCLAMRERTAAGRIVLVGRRPDAAALRAHRDSGGRVVTLEDGRIVRVENGIAEGLVDLAAIPATLGGRHGGKVWNALFAVAIADALRVPAGSIRDALHAFGPSLADSEGRFSVVDRLPFRVILDHATGREATAELAAAARSMPTTGRRLVHVMASGQMSQSLIRDTGRALAGTFDLHVCTSWARRPPPEAGLVERTLRDGLLEGGVPPDRILCIAAEDAALRRIFAEARAGDLVVVITAEMDAAVALIDALARQGLTTGGPMVS